MTQPSLEKPWHSIAAEEAASSLDASVAAGLNTAEVTRRQAESGPNRMSARRGTPAWLKFLLQFHQPLVYIMLVAVSVTAFLGEWVDAAVIGAIVIINAIVGYLQESKAETAIEALAKMVVTQATVRRDGKNCECLPKCSCPAMSCFCSPATACLRTCA